MDAFETLAAFGVRDPVFVAETAIARVFRVTRDCGDPAALKIYRSGDMRGEGPGFGYTRARAASGAAQVYRTTRFAALLEWLDGPSLGDLSREGQDVEAARALGGVAQRLMRARGDAGPYPGVEEIFRVFFDLRFAPEAATADVAALHQAQALARHLLDTQPTPRALHGDLHHDNVKLGQSGYRAFDAKGLRGDPAFELANAFRNPTGFGEQRANPARIEACARQWAAALSVPRPRLLAWAAAKCGWSIALRAKGRFEADPETPLLHALLRAAKRAT